MENKLKISLCTEMIFGGEPLHEILPVIKDAGYEFFEFWGWGGKNINALEKAIGETGLTVAAFCTKNSNLVDAKERKNYIEGFKETLPIAKRLGCKNIITTVGQRLDNISDEVQTESIIAGLKEAAPLAEEAGVTLVMEPLNIIIDHKGYFLDRTDKAFSIIKEVGSPNIKLLFDIYHQQITEGNLIKNITENIDLIGHFHSAGVPGRHELDSGEINYINVAKAITGAGYQYYFGLEYSPAGDRAESIKKMIRILN